MITKLAITPGFDFAAYASSGRQSVVVPPATSPLYRVKLDVHVVTAPSQSWSSLDGGKTWIKLPQ